MSAELSSDQPSQGPGLSLDNRHKVCGNRNHADAGETRGVEQVAPIARTALSAAGYSEHVEVAHETLLEFGGGVVHDVGQNELDHQQTALGLQRRTAVAEDLHRRFIGAAVET